MAYKSLIDYYGGGMVKPSYGGAAKASRGYYVGGQVSDFGVKSQSAEDRRVLKKKIEADRSERGGGSASFVGGLIGTGIGTLFGMPQVGGAIGAGYGQRYTESKYKPKDLSGGLYALDVADQLKKEQQEYKKGGTGRIAKAGFMGYLGGGEGGMFSDIWGKAGELHKGAVASQAAKVATKAQAALTPLERGKQLGSEYMERVRSEAPKAFEPSNIGIEFSDYQRSASPAGVSISGGEEWMVPDTSHLMKTSKAFEPISDVSDAVSAVSDVSAAIQPEYAPPVDLITGIYGPLAEGYAHGSAPQDIRREESIYDMITGGYDSGDIYAPYQLQMAGGIPNNQQGGLIQSLMPEGYQVGGFVEYQQPKNARDDMSLIEQIYFDKWQKKPWQEKVNFQDGGPVGYGTATDPLEALRQAGLHDVASDTRLPDYLEDAPQFGLGFKQKMGDITAGGRSSLLQARKGKSQAPAATFAQSGAVNKDIADISRDIKSEVTRGKRGVGEDYLSSVISWLGNVEQEAGIKFGDRQTYRPDWAQDEPVTDPNWSPPAGTEGATYNFNGTDWVFSGGSWMTREEQEQEAIYGSQADIDFG